MLATQANQTHKKKSVSMAQSHVTPKRFAILDSPRYGSLSKVQGSPKQIEMYGSQKEVKERIRSGL